MIPLIVHTRAPVPWMHTALESLFFALLAVDDIEIVAGTDCVKVSAQWARAGLSHTLYPPGTPMQVWSPWFVGAGGAMYWDAARYMPPEALEHLPVLGREEWTAEPIAGQAIEGDARAFSYCTHEVLARGSAMKPKSYGRALLEATKQGIVVPARATIEQIRALIATGAAPDYDSLTIAELRARLAARGIETPTRATKAQLIKMLRDAE